MLVRRAILFVSMVIACGLTMAGTGTASAEPQLPRITQYGENIGTVGDHDLCRGAVNIGMVAPRGKPGYIRITATSFGFVGQGPGWHRNPQCRFRLAYAVTSPTVPYAITSIPVSFGPRHGAKVVRDVHTGSGPLWLTVGTTSVNNRSAPQSYGTTFWTVVP